MTEARIRQIVKLKDGCIWAQVLAISSNGKYVQLDRDPNVHEGKKKIWPIWDLEFVADEWRNHNP